MIDPTNDYVQVYEDTEGMYRWRRVDKGNGRIVSVSGEGYVSHEYAYEAARAYNADLTLDVDE